MTQPNAYPGRPATPAPGVEAREFRIARLRPHARRLFWSALVVIAAAGAAGYFTDNVPAPFENWMLWTAAGALALLLGLVPYIRWLSRTYTITTRRVIVQSGIFGRRSAEIMHARGYTIRERRGPLQRMWGSGTLTLTNGIDEPLRLVNVPSVRLVHEALADQVEVNQILAHRDATWDSRTIPAPPGPPPPLP